MRQRPQIIDALRGYLAEFGSVATQGPAHVTSHYRDVEDVTEGVPEITCRSISDNGRTPPGQHRTIHILVIEAMVLGRARRHPALPRGAAMNHAAFTSMGTTESLVRLPLYCCSQWKLAIKSEASLYR